MYYPMKFKPIYKEMVWGGSRLKEKYGRDIPSDKTGEAWDVSCRDDAMSIIVNGEYAGRPFREVLDLDQKGFLGSRLSNYDVFPLLAKIIDANEDLSIQVHPNDDYAQKTENLRFGKTEMWYILYAPPGASLIMGLNKEVTTDEIINAACDGSIEHILKKLPVQESDVIEIPAGLIHALTAGVMVLEIQQNSNTTYRLYDYGKVGLDNKPRELHITKAADVIDIDLNLNVHKAAGSLVCVFGDGNIITRCLTNAHFTIDKYVISSMKINEGSDGSRFSIFTCVDGSCVINTDGGGVDLNTSESVFMPAAIGDYSIFANNCTLIKSYVTIDSLYVHKA